MRRGTSSKVIVLTTEELSSETNEERDIIKGKSTHY